LVNHGEGATAVEKETILRGWKDFGDISNVNYLQREVSKETDYRYISPNMSGDIITGLIQKE